MESKRLMIGQFGRYNEEKQKRDFRDYFFGVEACLLESDEDINTLKHLAKTENFGLGIHFPLRANQWRLRDPQYLSIDEYTQKESYDYMEREFHYASDFGAGYILVHFPKPVIIDDSVDWSSWRFTNETEYYYESSYEFDKFSKQSEQFFSWLSRKGYEHNFTPVLELDAVNKYIYETDLLLSLLDKYSNIKLCLDIGRIHLQDRIDPNFNGYEFVELLARYAEVVHLWNVRVDTNVANSHFPTLPSLSIEDGWADVETYLKIISKYNKTCKILFEHRSDLISDEELESCYEWVSGIIAEELSE